MRELQESFIGRGQVKGFEFTQIKKTDWCYIYKVDTKHSIHYEVFQRRENSRFNCISYPSNKSFGVWAWTFKNDIDAFDKLADLGCAYLLKQ